jgi:hypothetical protein
MKLSVVQQSIITKTLQERMPKMKYNFLDYKRNVYSQNGEDGIIDSIFNIIGFESYQCCEFGAWDGIHFSNTRNLILKGLSCIMIEGEDAKFNELVQNYHDFPNVICINKNVDTKDNKLKKILIEAEINNLDQMDFLSIDIDGLDYEIFESLNFNPRVICVEINAGHEPDSLDRLNPETACNNIGQPFGLFCITAHKLNYGLVGYSGNAFFVRKDILKGKNIDELSNEEAYLNFLKALNSEAKEWLYLVSLGLVPPYYRYSNRFLNETILEISKNRTKKLLDLYQKKA